MRGIVFSVIAALAIGITGCGGDSPEDLAKKFIEASKAGKTDEVKSISEKVSKMSAADQKKFGELTTTALMGDLMKGMGDMMKGMGDMGKGIKLP